MTEDSIVNFKTGALGLDAATNSIIKFVIIMFSLTAIVVCKVVLETGRFDSYLFLVLAFFGLLASAIVSLNRIVSVDLLRKDLKIQYRWGKVVLFTVNMHTSELVLVEGKLWIEAYRKTLLDQKLTYAFSVSKKPNPDNFTLLSTLQNDLTMEAVIASNSEISHD